VVKAGCRGHDCASIVHCPSCGHEFDLEAAKGRVRALLREPSAEPSQIDELMAELFEVNEKMNEMESATETGGLAGRVYDLKDRSENGKFKTEVRDLIVELGVHV
jgi:hypothetical protein